VTGAEYFSTAGALQALGVPVASDVISGLRISLTHRVAARIDEELPDAEARSKPETWFAGCRTTELPIHLCGAEQDAIPLYEQIISGCTASTSATSTISAIRGDRRRALHPADRFRRRRCPVPQRQPRISRLELLREYFVFPRVPGFQSGGLRDHVALRSKSVDIVLAFDKHDARPRRPYGDTFTSTPPRPSTCSRRQRPDPDQVQHP
jgi:type VI secretion system protein ImpG